MNVDKSKALALGGEKGSMCEVTMNGRQLQYISEFKKGLMKVFSSSLGILKEQRILKLLNGYAKGHV